MSRELYELKNFDYGIIKRADPIDIPSNAASDSNNIDGDAAEGRLQGIPAYQEYMASVRGFNAKRSAWIVDSDGKWNLVYVAGDTSNEILVITDWYGSFANSGLSVAYNGYSFVVHNQECHIGCGQTNEPQWIGKISYGQFNTTPLGWKSANAAIPQPGNSAGDVYASSNSFAGGTMAFDASYTYQYGVSMVYDYTQESPMGTQTTTYNQRTNGDTASITVTITANTIASINPRVTAVKLYRREKNDFLPPFEYTLWRLVDTVEIANSTAWSISGGDRTITVTDDNTVIGASYEQETGIAETLTTSSVKYTLSCECNGSMFVTGCSKTEIPDASHMVFKSKSYRYDMFDWSKVGEFLRLPTLPTAFITFNGRVYAFDTNNLYKINPDLMTIEETAFGVGCLSQRSILVTPYGMFWCDETNAYWHDGSNIIPIGDTIKADTGAWHGFLTSYATDVQDKRPIVTYSPLKTSILFTVPYDGAVDVTNVWAFHVKKKRWDSWTSFTPDCGSSCGAFTGKNGEVYVADGISKLYDALGNSTKRAWTWTSKDLDLETLQYKIFYYLYTRNTSITSAPTFNYGTDGGALTGTFTSNKFNNGTWPKVKTMKLKITEGGYGNTVDAMEIVYRRMKGER